MNKIFTVGILGVGARGGAVYGRLIKNFPEQFKIVTLCDIREERLKAFGEEFNVPETNRFTDEKEFFTKKRADLLVIATQDQDHVRNCLQAFEKGYDILYRCFHSQRNGRCDIKNIHLKQLAKVKCRRLQYVDCRNHRNNFGYCLGDTCYLREAPFCGGGAGRYKKSIG